VNGSNIFAGTNNGIFLSTDNGTSWNPVNTGLTESTFPALAASGNNLFAGAAHGISLSTNNGMSWKPVNTGLALNPDIRALAVSGSTILSGCYAGFGVFRSTDNGSNWTLSSTGMTNTGVTAMLSVGSTLFAATIHGVFSSTDNGDTWLAANNGMTITGLTGLDVRALVSRGTSVFAATTLGGVFRSSDNGASWSTVNNGLTDLNANALVVSGPNLLVGTTYSGVLRSNNNGASWIAASTGLTSNLVTAFMVKGAKVYAVNSGGAFRSINNGVTWTEVDNGLVAYVQSLTTNGGSLFAGTDKGVFQSTDDGDSWFKIYTDAMAASVLAVATVDSNLFDMSLRDGILLSTDTGSTWTNVSKGLPLNTSVYSMAAIGTTYFAGTAANGVWKRSLPNMLAVGDAKERPMTSQLAQNYPNPFNPTTTISFVLTERSMVQLEVFDMLGRKIETLVNVSMDAGSHSVRFDAGDLPSGIYTACLTSNGGRREMKMILNK